MKNFFLFAIACLLVQATISQPKQIFPTIKESSPEAGGFSAERLARIDKVVNEYVNNQWFNGGVALIVRNGKIVYYKAFGYDDLTTKKPMQRDAIFRIASQTKAITSVAVMMLYEEGKLMLEDPISKYIPEFKNPKVVDKYNAADTTYTTVPAKREVTIRDLLTHTSGIGYAQIGTAQQNAIYYKAGVIGGIGVDNVVLGDKMKILGRLPLFHQPGERWTYGLNTDVLGYLVEVVSGMNLDQFFRQRIFEPLGMNDTYFYLPKEKHQRLVNLYTEDTATRKAVKMSEVFSLNGNLYRDYPNSAGTYYSGGGGLSSTVYDYAIFLQMMLNGGTYNGKRILSRNTVRMMTMNQVGDLGMWGGYNKFGLGFGVATERSSAMLPVNEGTFDWGGMFATTYWVDPKENMVALFYRNIYPTSHWNFGEKYKILVYQAIND
ncbi:MAG TPA: serine hydrolase domain-containing protein [Chitinophagaceae bacterium]|nr:serine hydrolase domain-containing protein [Chitinophagaceae bacterium]